MYGVAVTDPIAQKIQGQIPQGGPSVKFETAPRTSACVFDPSDLRMIEEITEDILAALVHTEDDPLEAGVTEDLRLWIAAALFECAKAGEHDRRALSRRVLDQFHALATAKRAG
jgi:hypothetical protein